MLRIAKRTGAGAALLLVMPVCVWVSGWRWSPQPDSPLLRGLYWLTETVTPPWGLLTCLLLGAWFLWCLRYRLRPAVVLLCILGVAILGGQAIKTLLKNEVREPRPFVHWMEQTYRIDDDAFYRLNPPQRAALIQQTLVQQSAVPVWLWRHWQVETSFAFPSGHTIFAVSWALLALGLLWPRRHFLTVVLMFGWAAGVMLSRLLLGMHWPQDLIVGTLISWLLVTVASWLVQRWCGSLTLLPAEREALRERRQD